MSSAEEDFSQTQPRRGFLREQPRAGGLVVLGNGTSLEGLRAPRLVPMDGLALEIGRRANAATNTGAQILVLADSTVSGVHARIQRATSGSDLFIVQDLGSTNGTYVDGRRISGPVPLRDGAVLFLGSQALVFRLYSPAELEAVDEDAREPLAPVPTFSPGLAVTLARLRRLAATSSEVLLLGETGVGKEVFANAIHAKSGRKGGLVAINCAAIPRELVESELFGYEKGAHSTAQGRKTGLVELADGGTLFLDEIGDMPAELQSKLLRFLQDRRFTPLGSTRVVETDVRIIAATSRVAPDKGVQVQEAVLGRLGAQPAVLPPLRDRIEDIGRLAAHFLDGLRGGRGRAGEDDRAFEPEAFQAMLLHAWPLNVRELSKVVSEAEVLSRGAPSIGLEHLPDAITATLQVDAEEVSDDTNVDFQPPDVRAFGQREDSQSGVLRTTRLRRPAPTRQELTTLLGECDGSVAEVARRLKRQYAVVWRCVQRYGIDTRSFRRPDGGS
jgi:transcriptional regulator with GAF, ATPase, and Fis domain